MQDYLSLFIDAIIVNIPNAITALLIFIATLYIARILSDLLRRVLQGRRVAPGITHLLAQLTRWTIIVIGVTTALQRFFDVTAFLTGLGILGFTIGFALQDTMKNLAAGIILLVQQPFHIDETVGAAGFDGTILSIDLRTTEMETTDGRIVTLPNATVLANPIVNYTRARRSRVDLTLNLPHKTDPDSARRLVLDSFLAIAGFVNEPAPKVVFTNLSGSSVELVANFWVDASKTETMFAKDSALLKIKSAFAGQGIEIPLAAQTVLVQSQS